MNDSLSSPDALHAALYTCLAVPRWVDDVTANAPFASTDHLLDAARAVSPLTPDEVKQALSDHPRIGEAPRSDSPSSSFSRKEQESVDADDVGLSAAIAAGNRDYERRFDRIFLIRAAGRNRAEILVELHRRLQLQDKDDLDVAASELRDIALLRLGALIAEGKL